MQFKKLCVRIYINRKCYSISKAACFLEFWKRYSAKITHRWDLTSFDVRDFVPRPEYVAALKKIYSNGAPGSGGGEEEGDNKIKYDLDLTIPFWSRKLPFVLLSYSTVLFMVQKTCILIKFNDTT